MMAPIVGVATTLPFRSCMLRSIESARTITCVLGLSLVSIAWPATATTSIPPTTALMRSGAVDGAKSNWRPSVPGRTERFGVTVNETLRPFLSKKPLSLAIHAGSHVTTGIYAARTGVISALSAGMRCASIDKAIALATARQGNNFSSRTTGFYPLCLEHVSIKITAALGAGKKLFDGFDQLPSCASFVNGIRRSAEEGGVVLG